MFEGSSHTWRVRALRGACWSSFAACLCAAVVTAACDESIEPTAPTDLALSVFGYLDASADTQWVRVMPIRSLKVTSEEALEATVTLEHLGTGRIVELRDSLFGFSSSYVHNFWTLEDIEPGAAYRFSARLEGKEPAEAVVEIPGDYEVEVAIGQVRYVDPRWGRVDYWPDYLRITGVKHLPFVTTITHFYDDCGPDVTRTPYQRSSGDDGAHRITIVSPEVSGRSGCGGAMVENSELWIAGSEVAWPVGQGYSPGGLGSSGGTSNVTNAVGFLGGVLSKVVPYEACELQGHDYCVLRYNPETATVSGTVRETRCGDGPIELDTLRMKELDRDPARIRTVYSTRAGEFVIGALEPGIPHVLWSRPAQIPVDSVVDMSCFCYVYTEYADAYTPHIDTLTFVPGQHLEYNINLERLTPCGEPPPGAR